MIGCLDAVGYHVADGVHHGCYFVNDAGGFVGPDVKLILLDVVLRFMACWCFDYN
jgi:hypothetical protein